MGGGDGGVGGESGGRPSRPISIELNAAGDSPEVLTRLSQRPWVADAASSGERISCAMPDIPPAVTLMVAVSITYLDI